MFHASFWRWLVSVVSGTLLISVMLSATAFAHSSSVMRSYAAATKATSAATVVAECPTANPGDFRCDALRLVGTSARTANLNSLPSGYHPADLQSAYKLLSGSKGKGQLVAIVDAFDDPNAENDLAVYRAQFGLPPCTSANGCFKKVNQTGGTTYPTPNTSWAAEISLDLDMVSAICPNCHILLVEADSASRINLGIAVNEAVTLGANEVSNSYSGSEFAGEQTLCSAYYDHPGVAITTSVGDNGFAVRVPAACNTVTAVGGTSLSLVNTTWYETVWKGSGSGCSAYIAKPVWQHDTGCSMRTHNDVSAVADPETGVSTYDTYNNRTGSGWSIAGGTSASAPIIAAVYALAGNAATVNYGSYPYLHGKEGNNLRDVTVGNNGTCSPAYLCTSETGYDGPTGLGTAQGTGAF